MVGMRKRSSIAFYLVVCSLHANSTLREAGRARVSISNSARFSRFRDAESAQHPEQACLADFAAGPPHYRTNTDGRFLIKSGNDSAGPEALTVIVNWQALLK
jgi:hypothetical protein